MFLIFGFVWGLWHLPLFWIAGTYHYGLRQLGIGYMLNFLISISPLGFLTTWVYVKNNRSMLACIIFHLLANTMQEKIAMTPPNQMHRNPGSICHSSIDCFYQPEDVL
jgi:hypothetical protein